MSSASEMKVSIFVARVGVTRSMRIPVDSGADGADHYAAFFAAESYL
jgi:hypothetical protein